LILFISLILFSIIIQSLINELKLFSSHSFFIILPLSIDFFILLGNFSLSLIKSSLKYFLSNLLFISNNNWSSFSFNALLILVNIVCIFNFKSSLFLFISSYILFNLLIYFFIWLFNSSKLLIFSFNLFYFSLVIYLIRQTSQ